MKKQDKTTKLWWQRHLRWLEEVRTAGGWEGRMYERFWSSFPYVEPETQKQAVQMRWEWRGFISRSLDEERERKWAEDKAKQEAQFQAIHDHLNAARNYLQAADDALHDRAIRGMSADFDSNPKLVEVYRESFEKLMSN